METIHKRRSRGDNSQKEEQWRQFTVGGKGETIHTVGGAEETIHNRRSRGDDRRSRGDNRRSRGYNRMDRGDMYNVHRRSRKKQ